MFGSPRHELLKLGFFLREYHGSREGRELAGRKIERAAGPEIPSHRQTVREGGGEREAGGKGSKVHSSP
jgi:hypothetical protein